MGARATVSSRLLWPFLDLLERAGYEDHEPLGLFGLSAEEVRNPDTRVTHTAVNRMLTSLVEVSGVPDVGLYAAELVKPGDFDLFELATRSRPTLGAAIESFDTLAPLLHDGVGMSLSEQDGHFAARLTLRHGLTLHPAGYEFVLALLLISMRRATGKHDLQPLAVSFPHPKPRQLSNHKRLFGCPLHFEASAASLHFSKVQLSLPLIHASDTVSAALERAAKAVMAGLPNRAELVVDVTSTINELLPTGRCDGRSVARALGMGSRTLQRRLQAEGTSFKQLLDGQRQRVAMSYLQETKLSLNEIAYLLAFANPQAFHRAFKRWTGTTAAVMRKTKR